MFTGSFFEMKDEKKTGGVGCANCPLRASGAKHTDLPPDGSSNPSLYILGDYPDDDDDRNNRPLSGKAGQLLRAAIPRQMAVRYNTCVRTHPPKNRAPTDIELHACRPSITQDIEKTKPRVILALGPVAQRFINGLSLVEAWRGRTQVAQLGSHPCWALSSYSPAYILAHGGTGTERSENMLYETWKLDIRRALKMVGWKPPRITRDDFLPRYITLDPASRKSDYYNDGESAVRMIEWLLLDHLPKQGRRVAFDYETVSAEPTVGDRSPARQVRPYGKGTHIASIAVSTGKDSWAWSYEHPRSTWTDTQRARIREAWRQFLRADTLKVVHNLAFEGEWSAVKFGWDSIENEESWDDTFSASYILDSREDKEGAHSLVSLCRCFCGIEAKPDPIDRSKIGAYSLEAILPYNARDAWATAHLARVILEDRVFEDEELERVYISQLQREFDVMRMQRRGISVDLEENKRLSAQLSKQLQIKVNEILSLPSIREFSRIYGVEFNPGSNKNVLDWIKNILRVPNCKKVDQAALDKIEHPDIKPLREFREISKNHGTYVREMANPQINLWEGDIIRPVFRCARTVTRRFSSNLPNFQNFPKRKNAEARRQMIAGKGFRIISADYGQIEFRCFGMTTKDERLIEVIKTGYDVHAEWRDRIIAACPRWLKLFDGDKKKARQDAKGSWTFAMVFGAGLATSKSHLKVVPEAIVKNLRREFQNQFPGVFEWHEKMANFYRTHGYVRNLEGFRRYAPMTRNECINTPVQSTACELIIRGLRHLTDEYKRTGDDFIVPVAQIHDDLTFIVPKSVEDDAVERISKSMLRPAVSASYCNVPLSVEVSVGDNWCDMKEVADFVSDKVFVDGA